MLNLKHFKEQRTFRILILEFMLINASYLVLVILKLNINPFKSDQLSLTLVIAL